MKASKSEIQRLKEIFLEIDTSGDGKLSFEEIKQGIEKMTTNSKRLSKSEYLKLMEAADKDRNTYVDYQEFIAAASDKAKLLNLSNLQVAFKLLDRDNSGRISVDEIREVFDTMGTKKEMSLWEDIMNEVDRDGDRMISFKEF